MPLLGGKGNKFKVDPPKIRIEKVTVERPAPKPKPKPQAALSKASSSSSRSPSLHRSSPKPAAAATTPRQKSHSPYPSSSDERRLERKRKAGTTPIRRSPVVERVTFDKDSDNDDDGGWMSLDARKRPRKGQEQDMADPNRQLRDIDAYEEPEAGLKFVHAVDVASLETKCVPVMGAQKEDVAIEMQYPSPQPREKYVASQLRR